MGAVEHGGRSQFETRTLLFSDIEGSTRLQAATGDAYADILETHRKLIREAMSAHNGTEHSTAGDGFLFVFRSARDGLAAAIDSQRALAAYAWDSGKEVRVRMGLHAGEIGWSDNDVVGLAINEAARIMDAAHGGQVLVSSVVRDLTAGAAQAGVSLRSLGPHRLKDFEQSIELLQVCHPDLLRDFPPPRTRDVVVSLPTYRTSFVGREREVADVLMLLAAGRHVTLTGVGGSGKTRLALEVAALDVERHPDGVFFVDLAPVADPDLVLGAVASAVNVQGDPSDLETMLLGYLSERRALVVLDNCEHLVDACVDVVDLILSRCPQLRMLVTSREAFQLDGEQTYSVPSLGVEDAAAEAVMLFVSRAQLIKTDFKITDANRDDVLAICRRLDGIPLAIELAAARVAHLSVADIAARLDECFDLLIGGRRRRAQRQKTLQAAMDWSWNLLSEDEQTLLRRLAVFAGSFTLDAATAVCGVRPTLDLLASLKAKSLVQLEEASDETRYRLLETVRSYAQDRLVAAGEAAVRRDSHRDWYLTRLEELALDDLMSAAVWVRLLPDFGNLRAATDWTVSQDRPELLARLMMPMSMMLMVSPSLVEETCRWLVQVGEDERLPAPVRADAFACLALGAVHGGDYRSIRSFAERSLALDAGDRPFLFIAFVWLNRLDEASAAALRVSAPGWARFCRALATNARIATDPAGALEVFEEVGATARDALGWDWRFAMDGALLARLALGDATGAIAAIQRLRADDAHLATREQFLGSFAGWEDVVEAMALADLGRFDEARLVLVPTIRTVLRDRYPILAHDFLVALSYVAFREGNLEGAASQLDPVLRDGRLRRAPLYAFTFRYLEELRAALVGADIESSLPNGREFQARLGRVLAEGEAPDPATAAEIEAKLAEFIA